MSVDSKRLRKEYFVQEHHGWDGKEHVVRVPLGWNQCVFTASALKYEDIKDEQDQQVSSGADPADPRAHRKDLMSSGSVEDKGDCRGESSDYESGEPSDLWQVSHLLITR